MRTVPPFRSLLYETRGDAAAAEPLYRQALAIRKIALGTGHPDYAQSARDLGSLLLKQGDHARAEPLIQEVVDLRRKTLGENHPRFVFALSDLALLHHVRGQPEKAEPVLRQSLAILEQFLEETFAVLSERQRLQFLEDRRATLNAYLTVAPAAGVAEEEIYRHVMAWKGMVVARQGEERVARASPELRPLLEQMVDARARLANHAFTVAVPGQQADWLAQLERLRQRKEELEGRLAQASKEYRRGRELARLAPADVARALPEGTVLVDCFFYKHQGVPAGGKEVPAAEDRLAVFVLGRDGKPARVVLRLADSLVEALLAWRRALQGGSPRDLEKAAAEVQRRFLSPLQPHLTGARTLLLALDGPLFLMPLAALPGRQPGSFLLEDMGIATVTSARHAVELLRDPAERADTGLLAVGGIDYQRVEGSPFANLPGTSVEAVRTCAVFRRAFPGERSTLLAAGQPDRKRMQQELARRGLKTEASKPLPDGSKVQGRAHPALWAAFVLSGDFR